MFCSNLEILNNKKIDIEINVLKIRKKGKKTMKHIFEKAQTLIEALPYIRKFNGAKIVVKYGGSAMLDEKLKQNVIKDVALLKLVGMKPIIVHGGGKEISRWIEKVGKEPKFIDGLRVTDEETMELAEMVLGKVNKGLVAMMEKQGIGAVGLSGKDGNLLQATKKLSNGKDLGYVGEITEVHAELLENLMEQDYVPVIAPIGMGEDMTSYNINADDAACAIAKALKAEKLVFLTDIEGIYLDKDKKDTLLSEITVQKGQELIQSGVIGGGMLPKLSNCMEAVEQGVERVHIIDGRQEHCLLLEFFTEKGIGTMIVKGE